MENLAITYRNQGQFQEAEALQVRVLEGHKRQVVEDHSDVLLAKVNLAITYWNQGRFQEAEALGVRVLEGHKRVLGEDQPLMLQAMS